MKALFKYHCRIDEKRRPALSQTNSNSGSDSVSEGASQTDVVVEKKSQVQRPPLYKVLLHNDDYTTMDFVILIMKKYFGKSQEQAMDIMLNIHQNGVGICGVYTYEVAETKCQKVTLFSRQSSHPLKCTIEKK